MKKLRVLLLCLVCISALLLGSAAILKHKVEQRTLAEAERIIQKVEAFKTRTGRLPQGLSELGEAESESGPVYFQRESEGAYSVWYGMALGESRLFSSDTRQWTRGG